MIFINFFHLICAVRAAGDKCVIYNYHSSIKNSEEPLEDRLKQDIEKCHCPAVSFDKLLMKSFGIHRRNIH